MAVRSSRETQTARSPAGTHPGSVPLPRLRGIGPPSRSSAGPATLCRTTRLRLAWHRIAPPSSRAFPAQLLAGVRVVVWARRPCSAGRHCHKSLLAAS